MIRSRHSSRLNALIAFGVLGLAEMFTEHQAWAQEGATVQPAPASPPPSQPAASAPAAAPSPEATPTAAPVTPATTPTSQPAEAKPAGSAQQPQSLWVLSQTKPGPTKQIVPEPQEPVEIPATLDNLGNFQDHWLLFVHLRGMWISDAALDPFADKDFIGAFGLGGSRTLYSDGQWSVAVTALAEASSTKSSVRGSSAELDLARLEGGPELRMHWIPRSYVFLRALPGVLSAHASLDDVTVGGTLEDNKVAFAADLGAGIAFTFGGKSSGEGHGARFWVAAEGGYGVGSIHDFSLTPKNEGAAPARFQAQHLDAPSLNGPLMRLTAAVSF